MSETTVELPAEEKIVQLAHDIVREENEHTVPFLLDFYDWISAFEEDEHKTRDDIERHIRGASPLARTAWRGLFDELGMNDVIEEHHGGNNLTFTLHE